ncbi:MAG: hypothetical protein ACYDA8_17285, partial [Deferrisomatales bacterium]
YTQGWQFSEPWLLQWGRGFAAAEGQESRVRCRYSIALQWGRGFAAAEGSTGAPMQGARRSFNGAAASQPRKVFFCILASSHRNQAGFRVLAGDARFVSSRPPSPPSWAAR